MSTSVTKAQARPATTEITFDFPVKVGDKEVTSVTMRRQKVRDAMDAEIMAENDTDAAREVSLFAVLLGVPADDIMEMDMEDYKKVQDGYLFLTGNRSITSEISSENASSSSPNTPDGA